MPSQNRPRFNPMLVMVVAALLAVAIACAGEAPTPTSAPTATPAPTATAPAATAPAAALPTATAAPEATATPVPEVDIESLPYAEHLMALPGYLPEWGTPKTGGTLKIGAPRTPPRFHTAGSPGGTQFTGRGTHAGLLAFNPWTGVGPEHMLTDTAKSWEFSGDGLQLTFNLKKGVLFHDNPVIPAEFNGGKIGGDELTCEDVAASLERVARPPAWETRTTRGKGLLGHINSVSCPDGELGHTAVFNLDYSKPSTLGRIATRRELVLLDKEWIEWYWEGDQLHGGKGLDTGSTEAFMLQTGYGPWEPVDYRVDIQVKYKAFPDFYREGAPLADNLHFQILKDATTRFAALVTGKIHYYGHSTYSMTPGLVDQALRDFPDQVKISRGLGNWAQGFNLNNASPPFDDVRVRKAMFLAIDRAAWQEFNMSGPWAGAAFILGLQPMYYSHTVEELLQIPGIRAKDSPEGQEDIAEANRLLDEVYGEGNRPEFQFLSAHTQANVDMALFGVDQVLRHLGITATTKIVDSTASKDFTNTGNYHMTTGSSSSTDAGDPDDDVWTRYHRDFVSRAGWTGERMDAAGIELPEQQARLEALIEQQAKELDQVKRREMAMELDMIASTEIITQVVVGATYLFQGIGPDVKGYVLKDYTTNVYNTWERMWLAD